MPTTTTRPTTLLSPNDPELGSSYEAGVERARRVNAQKTFDETGVDPNAPTQQQEKDLEEITLLNEFGAFGADADPSKFTKQTDNSGYYSYGAEGGKRFQTNEEGLANIRAQVAENKRAGVKASQIGLNPYILGSSYLPDKNKGVLGYGGSLSSPSTLLGG